MANEIYVIYDTGLTLTAYAYYNNAGTMALRGSAALTEEPAGSGVYTNKVDISGLAAGDIVKITDSVLGFIGSGQYLPGVDIQLFGGSVQSMVDLKNFADFGYDPLTHKIEACKVNDDMRGTDDAALASICTETRLAKLDATVSSRAVAGDKMNIIDAPNSTGIAAFVTAIFAKVGITAGGTWTVAKILKILAAWAAGKWQDKSGSPGTYEVLDAEDGTTKILEVTPDETSPQKETTIS